MVKRKTKLRLMYKTKWSKEYANIPKGKIATLERIGKGEWALFINFIQIGSTDTKKVLMKKMRKLMK